MRLGRSTAILLLVMALCCAAYAQPIVKDGDTIAFLGDSITAGGAGFNGYGSLVMRGLKAVGIDATPVWAGVPGNTSVHMLLRLDSAVLDHKPDFVFLSAGVNDIWHLDPTLKIGVFTPSPGMGVDFEDYKRYVTQIVDMCTKADARVILSTITPIMEDQEFRTNKKAEQYGTFLRALAEKRGLPLAELHEAMFAEIARLKAEATTSGENHGRNMLTGDGVHPGGAGHRVMAKGVLKAMGFSDNQLALAQKAWDETPMILLLGDRQSNAGGRTGGWQHLLLDGLNSDDTIGIRFVKIDTVGTITNVLNSLEAGTTTHALLQAPLGDVTGNTPLDTYKDSVVTFVNVARKKELEPALITIPLRDGDEGDSAAHYSSVLREVSRELDVPLADVADEMRTHYEEHPGARLTIGDERLNHEGGKILVETVLLSMGYDEGLLPGLREKWDRRNSYTFRYSHKAQFRVSLSKVGREVVDAIPRNYHGMGADRAMWAGLYHLVKGDAFKNRERLNYFDREWASRDQDGDSYDSAIRLSASASQLRAYQAYMEDEGIDMPELFTRAFKVGIHIFEKEHPLGRKE